MRELTARRARVHEAVPLPTGHATALRRWWAPWRTRGTVLDPDLPLFVPREVASEVTTWMRRARRDGGFLLLVGTSSVGKTRLLLDTARRQLGDFRVLAPDLGDGGAVNALADTAPPGPVVVWLDELQRFLAGPYFVPDDNAGHVPVTAAALRRLLDGDTPVVVLATLWPDYLDQLRAGDTQGAGVTRSRHPGAADVLALRSTQLRVDTFTAAEKQHARELGERDPRLAVAARSVDFNVTESLAGAARILQRYREAPATRQAVVHAAIDARRLGVQGPLSRDLLREAARGYLTDVHPDDTWFDRALVELTRHDRRDDAATAPLPAIPTADHRGILGYTVADYLLQELLRERRSALLTDTTWNVLIDRVHDLDDRRRLAWQAQRRIQYRHAYLLHRSLADRGDNHSTVQVAKRLAGQDRTDEAIALLRPLTGDAEPDAARFLAELLAGRGDLDAATTILRGQAVAGDRYAAMILVDMLIEHDRLDEVLPLAIGGDSYASSRLALVLAERRMEDELRHLVDTGVDHATIHLAGLLMENGEVDEGQALLRAWSDAGHARSLRVALSLAEQGHPDEAVLLLRTFADDGNPRAAALLPDLSGDRSALEKLRAHTDTADIDPSDALRVMVNQFARHGMVEQLRARADAGDTYAAQQLNDQLVSRNMVDELRARADNGDADATAGLARLVAGQGNLGQAVALLRVRADTDHTAALELIALLTEHRELQLLWQEVHAGTTTASYSLIELLRATGRDDQAERLTTWGVLPDGSLSPPW